MNKLTQLHQNIHFKDFAEDPLQEMAARCQEANR